MKSYKTVAMLLAGGQGSRLGALTHNIAKPAVAFGGKYRIIDFPLSNCRFSDIHVVGVLTQYKPLLLNAYISTGASWALDSLEGGVSILPPYMDMKGGTWYQGTADAVYQNIEFIDQYNPENVVVLSGDHVYKMDYQDLIDLTDEKSADAVMAVINVPIEEASRFGILHTDEENTIISFDEKPENPKGTKASMGVYAFKWNCLRTALIEDSVDKDSRHDFGKNIIPKLLKENKKFVAYEFDGYWKDIGTIDSYYETNMELLQDPPPINLNDKKFPIYSNMSNTMPPVICEDAEVSNSLICNGCVIEGVVKNSIIAQDVFVSKGARVENSIILHDTIVNSEVSLNKTIVLEDVVVTKELLKLVNGTESNSGVRLLYNQQSISKI